MHTDLVATIKNEPVGYTLTTFLEPVHISPVLITAYHAITHAGINNDI
jgi:hypothetical protein